ncbi:MAG: sporulation protein YabP [Oscillospiraceae bacterium]|nr:sporulation protein YabP [Oscillospiraceae bacterium]
MEQQNHSIIIENRRKIVLTGVREVESFNDNDVIVITTKGALRIRGRGFEVGKVSVESGDMEFTGNVTSVHYSDTERTPNNFITKIFR